MNISKNNKLLLVTGVVFVALIGAVSFLSGGDSKKQQPSSNYFPTYAPATLPKSEKLYTSLGAIRFEQLRNDLTLVARDTYKSTNDDVVFEIADLTEKNEGPIVFTAKYLGTPSFSLDISATRLPNDRLGLTFKDKKSGDTSMSNILKSNSKRNTYIATLPVSQELFTIEFDATNDTFVVALGERSKAARDAANLALTTALGDISKEKISYLVPGSGDTF
jgi:hypothetical protein